MYIPPAFREDRTDVLHDVIRRYAFGTLVSTVGGELFATHLPFLLDTTRGERGALLGHMARANPHWRTFAGGPHGPPLAGADAAAEVLALFQGPHAYVSPAWYTVEFAVPTWNYVAVHAYGRPRVIDDPAAVYDLLERTVRTFESPRPPGAQWSMDRLDAGMVAKMAQAVTAFEIPISRLEGKQKLNQNRTDADRRGVVEGLRREGDPLGADVAALMAAALASSPGGRPA
jgi:transcriptional regulator